MDDLGLGVDATLGQIIDDERLRTAQRFVLLCVVFFTAARAINTASVFVRHSASSGEALPFVFAAYCLGRVPGTVCHASGARRMLSSASLTLARKRRPRPSSCASYQSMAASNSARASGLYRSGFIDEREGVRALRRV